MNQLQDKVAVVTGGNSGIGLAIAKRFRDEGAKVVVFGRSQETLDAAAAELGDAGFAVRGNVTSIADLDRLFSEAAERFGKIDALVVNAGVAKVAALAEIDEAAFDFTTDINFKGAFFTVQRALPFLNDGASIVLTSSVVNQMGFEGFSVYAATKAAVRSLARSFSAELAGRGIRVNVLSPGAIETPIYGRMDLSQEAVEAFGESIVQRVPLRRFGSAEEMASAALFLASSQSSYVVGAELAADGGFGQV
ncbi:MAG: SDR family oxidoreductase [Acidobacteria bacterium]|nr:SDR family oxidoreductase [Acidobacteriota bacterium]